MRLPNVKKPCKDCPFRKDSPRGWLGEDRMIEILQSDSFVCHKRTELQCAGHMFIKGQDNQFVRLASALRIDTRLTGRKLVFDTQKECVEHHS